MKQNKISTYLKIARRHNFGGEKLKDLFEEYGIERSGYFRWRKKVIINEWKLRL